MFLLCGTRPRDYHNSGFIIEVAYDFCKTLIEHTPKIYLEKQPSILNHLLVVFARYIGPLISSEKKIVGVYHSKLKFAIFSYSYYLPTHHVNVNDPNINKRPQVLKTFEIEIL